MIFPCATDMKKYEVDSDDDDELPFACFICREHFTAPVVTKLVFPHDIHCIYEA